MNRGVFASALDGKIDRLLERGHFLGKTGAHIDARLRKEKLFNDMPLLEEVLKEYLAPSIKILNPSLIIGQESSAALLGNCTGNILNVPSVGLPKEGILDESLLLYDTSRPVLIEDNYISGRSLRLALGQLLNAGIRPVGLMTLFSSNQSMPSEILGVPLHVSISTGINSWEAESCKLCATHGESSLGLTFESLHIHESAVTASV